MAKIRVLVIDDSAFMRKMISEILTSDQRIEVIGTARNGEDGLAKINKQSPDVVTLDIEMPVLDGLATLRKVMQTNPLPVVMVSSVTDRGAMKTIQAIANGAVDFIAKPSGAISLNINDIKEEIISKVINASRVKLHKRTEPITEIRESNFKKYYGKTVVAIGTSTGGPKALERILTTIPKNFSAPILIVQHMPAHFTKSLAKRLDLLCKINVKEANNGEIINAGTAYIAPGNFHMNVRKIGRTIAIQLTQDAQVNGHRPSVDVLFKSLAQLNGYNKVAVILTGMGRDGANGVTSIKAKDEHSTIIVESKQSSVVYGMPAATIQTGHVNLTTHLDSISQAVQYIVE